MQKTFYPTEKESLQEWVLVDANGELLGRLATRLAALLLGKHKPTYTPGVDGGDFVVVVNAERVRVTGKKLDEKIYYRYSGYPSGLRERTLRDLLAKHPDRVLHLAVWGMLPHNRMGRQIIKRLKIYSGAEHPHAAQQPKILAGKKD